MRHETMPFKDVWAIYQTVWGEARGETLVGKTAVAAVILNRAEDPRWAATPYGVVHQHRQFSAWNEGNPNREKMRNLPVGDLNKECMEATLMALRGIDPTGGATHYFAARIQAPSWADDLVRVKQIGGHIFLK